MTLATSPGYLHYPPTVLFANAQTQVRASLEANVPLLPLPCMFWAAYVGHYGRTSLQHDNRASVSTIGQQNVDSSPQFQMDLNVGNLHNHLISPMESSPVIPSSSNPVPEDISADILLSEMGNADSDFVMDTMDTTVVMDAMETTEGQDTHQVEQIISPSIMEVSYTTNNIPPPSLQSNGAASRIPNRQSRIGVEATSGTSSLSGNVDLQMLLRSVDSGQLQQNFPFGDPGCWELPFLQGWLMGQTHAGLNPIPSINDAAQEHTSAIRGNGSYISPEFLVSHNMDSQLVSSATATHFSQSTVTTRSGARHRSRSRLIARAGSGEGITSLGIASDESDPQPGVGRIESEFATSLAAAVAAELPCTVKLRIWPHNVQDPCAPLVADQCRLTIPHAVLCRYGISLLFLSTLW